MDTVVPLSPVLV